MTLSGRSVSATFSTPYYAAGAAQTFEVAVFDIHGNRRNVDVAITPQAPSNYAPQPQIRAACGVAGLAQDVQLTAADSIDPGGDPSKLLVEWDFNNDGIYDTAKIPISQHPTIRFFTPGTYAARARLTDAGGATSISAPFPVRILPTITGTTGSDNYYLRVDPGDAGTLQIFSGTGPVGQPAYALPAAWGETLVFNGGLGDDQLIIDFSHGAPLPAGGLTFTGGDGANRIRTIGSSGADVFTIGDNRLTLNGSEVTCSGVEEFAIDGAGGGDSVSLVDGAAVMFTADQHLASLSISGNARLNLQDHELLMDSADLMQIRSWIQSGSLFSDAAILGKSMALGYASSGNGVLVKYTYRGDADLDGDVDGDDVAEWAANFTGSLTNPASPKLWSQGDWDYDGDVDGDDVAKWAVNFTGALTSSGLSIEPSTIASSDSAQAAQAPAQSVEIAKPRCTPPQLRPPCRPPRVMTLALWHPDVRPAVRILPTRNSFPTAFSFRADGHGILRYVDQPEADDVISLG